MNDDNTCPKCWEQFASRIGLTEHKCKGAIQITQITSQQFVAEALGLKFVPHEPVGDEKCGGDA